MRRRPRAPVAQLDRALASGARGREFESRRARQFFRGIWREMSRPTGPAGSKARASRPTESPRRAARVGASASRFFAPAVGIAEDPVTGSVHCAPIPYWSRRLGKSEMFQRRVSARGGEIFCEDHGPRVRADVVKAAPHGW